MLQLHGQSPDTWRGEPFVARVTTNPDRPAVVRDKEVLLAGAEAAGRTNGFRACLCSAPHSDSPAPSTLRLPAELEYLDDGDVVRVSPMAGDISVLYRKSSRSNTILLTERCNCNCIMCPQPPRSVDDLGWAESWLQAIPLMDVETGELGISGGEPTLAPGLLLKAMRACKNYLPRTALHVLSNGRMFNYVSLCRDVAGLRHPDLMIGIPLYCDLAHMHDFIVQTQGAFDQTIRGLMNLARYAVPLELRIVVIRQNVNRLAAWARFVARNLPFVCHVALMGLEPMGYADVNFGALWPSPDSCRHQLREAVEVLSVAGMNVSIYNYPLCLLDRNLWPFARKSISDWKTEYLPVCDECEARAGCGGLFASAVKVCAEEIRPVVGRAMTSERP